MLRNPLAASRRSQIAISLLGDVYLWLVLPRVSAPRPQPEKTSHIAALPESARVFEGQDIRQRDQLTYAFHLLEQCDFRVVLLGHLFDPPIE